ncbi:SUKH-4 family immunity protein [Streptomyces sp. NPDC059816]|uniref:SUKH-4 family immunity protein n=1 Tax=Streptomyces sp. NPDC059816 TaxID=3346960 RepID=UPI00366661B6
MATTETIRFTEDELPRSLTHGPTRRHLTGPGLPAGEGPLFRFGPPRTLVGDLLVLGGLSTGGAGSDGQRAADGAGSSGSRSDGSRSGGSRGHRPGPLVTLEGATGRLFLTPRPGPDPRHHHPYDGPGPRPAPGDPLAPDLPTLLRFERAVREFAEPADPGDPPTDHGGPRYGPGAAALARHHLLDLFRAELHGAPVPVFWLVTAWVRPLARVPTPGIHLQVDLPGRLLDEEFGAGEVSRCEDADLPAALTHEPTRRFLKDVGLPEEEHDFVAARLPLRTLAEHHCGAHPVTGRPADLPARAARLIPVGHLMHDTDVVVDGATGAVLSWHWADPCPRPLNTDVSTLAFTNWLGHRARDWEADRDRRLTAQSGDLLAGAVHAVLKSVDPVTARHPETAWTPPGGRPDLRAPLHPPYDETSPAAFAWESAD